MQTYSQNLLKATISFVMSVCPSSLFARDNTASTRRIFIKFDIWVIFRKFFEKIQVSLKTDKHNWYFTWKPIYFYDNSLDSF